jgi:hypothetical protein
VTGMNRRQRRQIERTLRRLHGQPQLRLTLVWFLATPGQVVIAALALVALTGPWLVGVACIVDRLRA